MPANTTLKHKPTYTKAKMKSSSILTLVTLSLLAHGLHAADPAMCGGSRHSLPDGNSPAPAAQGKSAVQRSAEEVVAQLAPERQSDLLILLNEATEDRLLQIDGIASTRAAAIVAARPIGSITELIEVKGIGLTTLKRILAHNPAAAVPPAQEPSPSAAMNAKG